MWPYWFLFSIPALFALGNQDELRLKPFDGWTWDWYLTFFIMAVMIGFRYQVGGDWDQYETAAVSYNSFSDIFFSKEPAYALLNFLSLSFGGLIFINLSCGIIFTYGLIIFCRTLPFPWVGMTVAVPYLVMVVAMGYSRQGVAIGLFMLGIVKAQENKYWQYIIYAVTTCLFHLSGVVTIPLVGLSFAKKKLIAVPLMVLVVLAIYFLFIDDQVNRYVKGYLDSEYQSAGAEIRVWMNVIPSFVFLLIRNRLHITKQQRSFWTLFSFGAIGMVLALRVSSSSTAVDRIALYWIPIQIYVYGMVPLALKKISSSSLWIILLVFYAATIQFTWLNYAQTAFAWLPYRMFFGGGI